MNANAAPQEAPYRVDELGDEPTFRLVDLEAIHHRERHALELKDALGDGALLQRLPVLANARRALIERGYQFLPAHKIFGVHSLFPVLELTAILETKTIPYRLTASVVRGLLERMPEAHFEDALFRAMCAGSYTFHEGAHGIFYDIACTDGGVPRGRRFVEVMLASEAFAMAFEQFVALLALVEASRATALFLALSSYANPLDYAKFEQEEAGSLKRLGRLATDCPVEVMSFMAAVHLVALLRPNASAGKPGLADWFADYARFSPSKKIDAERLLSVSLHIDYEFRNLTQKHFFGFLGLEKELDDVRGARLEENFMSDSALPAFLPQSIATVLDRKLSDSIGAKILQ